MVTLDEATTASTTVRGTEVPWHFGDPAAEYTALRTRLGLVDLTHTPLVAVSGRDACAALDRVFTKELEYLSYESSTLGLFLEPDGRIVDACTVYRRGADFLVEPSVGGTAALLDHLRRHLDGEVEVTSLAGELGTIALEGPDLWAVAEGLVEVPLTGLPFQGVRPTTFRGHEVLAARTGWTGEFGLKFLLPVDLVGVFADAAADRSTRIGQWALEVSMLDIRQPVPHRELLDGTTVAEAGWNWLVDLEKEDFVGRDALVNAAPPRSRTVGFVSAADAAPGMAIETSDRVVGTVVWSVSHPTLQATLGLARVEVAVAGSGLRLGVRGADGELVPADTLSSPFVTPASWGMISSLTGDG